MNKIYSASDTVACYGKMKQGRILRRVGGCHFKQDVQGRSHYKCEHCAKKLKEVRKHDNLWGESFPGRVVASAKHWSGRGPDVPGGWWWGQCGTHRVGKGRRMDQKDNGANCQRPWDHGKRLTLTPDEMRTQCKVLSRGMTSSIIYHLMYLQDHLAFWGESMEARSYSSNSGNSTFHKGGSNGYIEKGWESASILKRHIIC